MFKLTQSQSIYKPRNLKCVLVGDGGAGKTCVLASYTTNQFPREYVPTVFDNFSTTVVVPTSNSLKEVCNLSLWDSAGQEEYDRLRVLSYTSTDVFVVVFSVANFDSYLNVSAKWVPELWHYAPNTPIVLVGAQIDLRDKMASRVSISPVIARNKSDTSTGGSESPINFAESCFISYNEGKQLAERLKASCYMECSALTHQGLNELFYKIAETGIKGNDKNICETSAGKEKVFEKSSKGKKLKHKKCSIL